MITIVTIATSWLATVVFDVFGVITIINSTLYDEPYLCETREDRVGWSSFDKEERNRR